MPEHPRLTYFDMRGRAEPIRLMLHATGTTFDDHRVVTTEEWSQLKSRLPFGALPAYEDHGRLLTQSHAIFRYLGRHFGWIGSDEASDVLSDVTQEALAEAQEDLWRFGWMDSRQLTPEQYAANVLVPRLARLEAWLVRDGRAPDFWVGASPTHVDFVAFCYLDEIDAFFPTTLARFAQLAAFRRRIEAMPAIATYVASGARPPVFGMGIRGPKIDPRARIPEGSVFRNPWTEPIRLA